jgi:cytochrome c553
MKSKYIEKLKDPRWQKKRLEVLQRDNWACQKCFNNESTLNVHHRRYLPDREPWDYPSEILITLCDECHEFEKEDMETQCISLIEQLQDKFLSEDINELAIGFHCLIPQHMPKLVASAIGWALSDEQMQHLIIEKYQEYLRIHHLDDKD